MASGKQQSFQYGEVSPSLRYMSDAASYSTGLSKLRNMYVRRTGGVSNRPGFEFVRKAPQSNIPDEGAAQGIKAFTFWSYEDNKWSTLEYFYSGVGPLQYVFRLDDSFTFTPQSSTVTGPTPDKMRFVNLKNKIFITPELSTTTLGTGQASINLSSGGASGSFEYGSPSITGLPAITLAMSGKGLAPFLEVSYLLTATLRDGKEVPLSSIVSLAIPNASTAPASGPIHPHSQASSEALITIASATDEIVEFSLYRGTGRGGLDGAFFKLAGKHRYNGTTLSIKMADFGAEDVSITPPLNSDTVYIGQLRGVISAAYYQQRLIMGMKAGTPSNGIPENIKPGDMLASKIGAPEQIIQPIIYSDTGAFQFSIPITDGTPCIALLSMERLIAFTERGVYVVRGGEQGVLTPTSVNPLLISEEGCSTTVEPKMVGKRGYFINNAHTKLMGIEFGSDGNLDIRDISTLSEHLILEDIRELEVLNDYENKVFLLRKDGKIVSITASEEGVSGYSLIETSGFIESIYRGKEKRPYVPSALDVSNTERYYDVLMAYVIRNGTRNLERINLREDKYREGEFYADCYASFGTRLQKAGAEGYVKLPAPDVFNCRINITSSIVGPTAWDAGTPMIIQTSMLLDDYVNTGAGGGVIHFFYDDAEGKTQFLRFMLDKNSNGPLFSAPFFNTYKGYFTSEVPSSLRDSQAQAISETEKKKRQRRWLSAVNTFSYLASTSGTPLYAPSIGVFTDHLSNTTESAPVAISADGEVISSPLNPNKVAINLVKTAGVTEPTLSIDLGDYYSYGYIGLPYTAEMETMDLETAGERTLTDANKLINSVGTAFLNTRGGFVGMQDQTLENMQEIVVREDQDFSNQSENFNGHIVTHIPAEWNEKGRINIKQVDPAPITVLSVYPKGISGD